MATTPNTSSPHSSSTQHAQAIPPRPQLFTPPPYKGLRSMLPQQTALGHGLRQKVPRAKLGKALRGKGGGKGKE